MKILFATAAVLVLPVVASADDDPVVELIFDNPQICHFDGKSFSPGSTICGLDASAAMVPVKHSCQLVAQPAFEGLPVAAWVPVEGAPACN